jgi:hypothetical protein
MVIGGHRGEAACDLAGEAERARGNEYQQQHGRDEMLPVHTVLILAPSMSRDDFSIFQHKQARIRGWGFACNRII